MRIISLTEILSPFTLNIVLAGNISDFNHHLDLLLHVSPSCFQSLTVFVS